MSHLKHPSLHVLQDVRAIFQKKLCLRASLRTPFSSKKFVWRIVCGPGRLKLALFNLSAKLNPRASQHCQAFKLGGKPPTEKGLAQRRMPNLVELVLLNHVGASNHYVS